MMSQFEWTLPCYHRDDLEVENKQNTAWVGEHCFSRRLICIFFSLSFGKIDSPLAWLCWGCCCGCCCKDSIFSLLSAIFILLIRQTMSECPPREGFRRQRNAHLNFPFRCTKISGHPWSLFRSPTTWEQLASSPHKTMGTEILAILNGNHCGIYYLLGLETAPDFYQSKQAPRLNHFRLGVEELNWIESSRLNFNLLLMRWVQSQGGRTVG